MPVAVAWSATMNEETRSGISSSLAVVHHDHVQSWEKLNKSRRKSKKQEKKESKSIMPDMVSMILIDFRVLAVPSEADIVEKIVRY